MTENKSGTVSNRTRMLVIVGLVAAILLAVIFVGA